MTADGPRAAPTSYALQKVDLSVADAVGALMELWGFRRQLGRIWAVLFLSERPLAAPELCDRLRISTGLLSMSLAELRRWGVVHRVEIPGDRKEHFEAETNVWRLVTRVLREREGRAVEGALATFERALEDVRAALADVDPAVKALARFKLRRLEVLAGLSRAALGVLRVLVDSARADVGPIKALSDALGRRG
ncbi:GbsR/MarR family transcriptional regulator [Anaeromyxobacter oryzisoli]|jgi:HTH-type transcriptional regulator, glycine betaine synthesis regulator|uniref:GbsR/MarR family transcriptional regulator n=1 Tax=Anaeromyxobacter oryzisoli TaxID=2925408 RepID=UPI001F588A69|nr:MarR family transcriptional regulator [Anaeromyxobacter sp. SG63]